MIREDFTDNTALLAYLDALPKFQREAYLENNPEHVSSDHGDLTDAQWREYGKLRRARGTEVAHAFATALRRAAWAPMHAPGTDGGHPIVAFFLAVFVTCAGIAAVLGALILYYYSGA